MKGKMNSDIKVESSGKMKGKRWRLVKKSVNIFKKNEC